MATTKLSFARGAATSYKSTIDNYSGCVYFDTTNKKIMLNGIEYGGYDDSAMASAISDLSGRVQTIENGQYVTGSGTANYIPVWTGAHSIGNKVQFGTSTSKVLAQNGTWVDMPASVDDSNLVHKSTDETITGLKTFDNAAIFNLGAQFKSTTDFVGGATTTISIIPGMTWHEEIQQGNNTIERTYQGKIEMEQGVIVASKFSRYGGWGSELLVDNGTTKPISDFATPEFVNKWSNVYIITQSTPTSDIVAALNLGRTLLFKNGSSLLTQNGNAIINDNGTLSSISFNGPNNGESADYDSQFGWLFSAIEASELPVTSIAGKNGAITLGTGLTMSTGGTLSCTTTSGGSDTKVTSTATNSTFHPIGHTAAGNGIALMATGVNIGPSAVSANSLSANSLTANSLTVADGSDLLVVGVDAGYPDGYIQASVNNFTIHDQYGNFEFTTNDGGMLLGFGGGGEYNGGYSNTLQVSSTDFVVSQSGTTVFSVDNVGASIYGQCTAAGFYESSDVNLKKNIEPMSVDIDVIAELPKVMYNWKDEEDSDAKHVGTIAQEVEKIYPDLVSTNKDGIKSVDYAKLSIVALAAIDQLNERIKVLESKLK